MRTAELIRPPTSGFVGDAVVLADASALRGYHASALLLPDASIFVTGGNGNWSDGPVQEFKSVEVFEPPYLAMGARPTILNSPAELRRGERFTVETTTTDVEPIVVLIRNGSRTHSLDTDQRMVRFHAQRTDAGDGVVRLQAMMPSNPTLVPPGPYMLFLLRRGESDSPSPQSLVPSQARFVHVLNQAVRPEVMVQNVRITIRTGGDDLRGGDDNAFADLFDAAGIQVASFPLNNGANWQNNTVHSVTHRLSPPIPLERLSRLQIRTTFGGGLSGDNWNIDRLIVDYQTTAGSWQTLFDRAGTPLVRLTGERRTWRTSL